MTDAPHVAILGGGHNGLICAAYLARAGARVTVLERREILGGACVTEECWPGYKVSRASYVVSLLRPQIVRDLQLESSGLRLLPRSPSSFTPLLDGRSLVLGPSMSENVADIRKFSAHDAEIYPRYEALLERIAAAIEPTLDAPAPDVRVRRPADLKPLWLGARAGLKLGRDLPKAARLLLGPARSLLEEYFDAEPLRATLATDAVIGAFAAPSQPGTGYVLFHHVMGSLGGHRGVWSYVQGGMGALTEALADAARRHGAELRTNAEVEQIVTRSGRSVGVALANGEEIRCDAVVSSADPARTFASLDDNSVLPEEFTRAIAGIDFRSPVVKINLALNELPHFAISDRETQPLTGTIHIGPTDLDGIERAYDDAHAGRVSELPVVELTIPSTLDPTLAPEGRYVASIFCQYAPALANDDPRWPSLRDEMRDRVFAAIERVAPGFQNSIEHAETLVAPDLEREFGLTGGNIFHGAMSMDRLLFMRPVPDWSRYRTPLPGLFLCGSGTHPGGGVMGAPGRNAALEIAHELGLKR